MIELGAIYTLTGPDGTRAVFNDSTDPDFVGWMRDLSGLDSPEVRLEVANAGQADGAYYAGPGYYGARQITMDGIIAPSTAFESNQRETLLRRATDAIRSDATLTWQPEGYPELQVRVRRIQPLRVRPGRPREFQLSLVATDPKIYSSELVTRFTTYGDNPYQTIDGTLYPNSVIVRAGNAGNVGTAPLITVTGPISSPYVTLFESAGTLAFQGLVLGAGDTLDIDVPAKTAMINGTTNAYGYLNWAQAVWPMLKPESYDYIGVSGQGVTADTGLRVTYRHAWM